MNSDPRQCVAGKVDFAPCLGFAEGAWRSRLTVRRVSRLALILFALWSIAGASRLSFAAAGKDDSLAEESTQSSGVAIYTPSVRVSSIRENVDRVIVPVTVIDSYGQILTHLDKDDFELFDDKVKQTILSFSTDDAPVTVGIIFDASQSMSNKIQEAKEAVLQFLKTSNRDDEFMLVAFNSRPYLISGFTRDYEKLLDQVLFTKSDGKTALLDAIHVGLTRLKQASADRKALLVISDGGNNHSRYTFQTIRKIAMEANVQIYTIGIFDPPEFRNRTVEEASGPDLLSKLAHVSGGRAFSADIPEVLPGIAEEVSIMLRNQYVIVYKPSNLVRDGGWRRIKINVRRSPGKPSLRVYARSGYYAPTQ